MIYKKNRGDEWWNSGFISGTIKEKSTHESWVELVVTVKRGAGSGPEFVNDMSLIFT